MTGQFLEYTQDHVEKKDSKEIDREKDHEIDMEGQRFGQPSSSKVAKK